MPLGMVNVPLGMVNGIGPVRASTMTGHAGPAAHERARVAVDRARASGAGRLLYAANSSAGFTGWTTRDGKPLQGSGWSVAGGQLVSDGRANTVVRAPYEPGKHGIANYTIQAQIRVLSLNTALPAPHTFDEWARGQGLDNNYGYTAGLFADQTPSPQLYSQGGVSTSRVAGKQFVQFNPLAWHTYREEVVGAQIRFLIDAVVVLSGTNTGWTYGGWVGLGANGTRIAVRSFTVQALGGPSPAYGPACGTHCGAGAVLYQTTWSQGAHSVLDWSAPRGDPKGWDVRRGMLLTNGGTGGLVRPDFEPGGRGLSDYAVEAQIKLLGVTPGQTPEFALRVHGQGIDSNYGFEGQLLTPAHAAASAQIYDTGNGSGLGGKRFVVFDPTAWHTYRVQVAITSVQFLLDGVPVVDTASTAWAYGGFGGIAFSGVKIAIRTFKIISLRGTRLPLVAPCTPHCGPTGVGFVLPTASFTAHNLLDWELISGSYNTWHLAGGALVGSNDGGSSLIRPDYEPGAWNRADYAVQAEFQVVSLPRGAPPRSNFGLIARGQGIDNNYGYQVSLTFNGTNWDAEIYSRSGGQVAAKTAFASFPLGSWHTLRIEVRGSQIQMLVDAHVALTGADTGWKYGGWGAVYYSGPQIAVRSFKIE